MLFKSWIGLLILLTVMIVACGEDDGPTNTTTGIDGADLLGLVDGRSFEYLMIDTVITVIPNRDTTVTTESKVITVSGSGNDWIISDNAEPVINIKLSDPYALMNGYWRKQGGNDVLVFFPSPVIQMPRSLSAGQSWESTVPNYETDTSSSSFPFYYAYFGYYTRTTYFGTEEVLVPGGAFDAHRFDVELFLSSADTVPAATAVEHYAVDIGPVKLKLVGGGFSRTFNLIDYQ